MRTYAIVYQLGKDGREIETFFHGSYEEALDAFYATKVFVQATQFSNTCLYEILKDGRWAVIATCWHTAFGIMGMNEDGVSYP